MKEPVCGRGFDGRDQRTTPEPRLTTFSPTLPKGPTSPTMIHGYRRVIARTVQQWKSAGVNLSPSMPASGADTTMWVALQLVYRCDRVLARPRTPAAPPDTLASLRKTADEAICLMMPIILGAIGF